MAKCNKNSCNAWSDDTRQQQNDPMYMEESEKENT